MKHHIHAKRLAKITERYGDRAGRNPRTGRAILPIAPSWVPQKAGR